MTAVALVPERWYYRPASESIGDMITRRRKKERKRGSEFSKLKTINLTDGLSEEV